MQAKKITNTRVSISEIKSIKIIEEKTMKQKTGSFKRSIKLTKLQQNFQKSFFKRDDANYQDQE